MASIPNLFSGIFNVARNPVTNRHAPDISPAARNVKALGRCHAIVTGRSRGCRMIELVADPKMLWELPEMPLVTINAAAARIEPAALAELASLLGSNAAPQPVVIMVHGYKFAPARDDRDPHRHIFSLRPVADDRKALSWPRHLGFSGKPGEGVCIAFGWQADGDIWRAYHGAERAGQARAGLIRFIRDLRPGDNICVFAHSLGARVTLSALPQLGPNTLDRAVLMAPAEFEHAARDALQSPAASTAQILSVTSRENDLFDLLFEWLLAPLHLRARSLGRSRSAGNVATLQIDHPHTLARLAAIGYRVAPPKLRVCHWSSYLRPGMFRVYRAFFRGQLSLQALAGCSAPCPSRRFSRLFALPQLPLPFLRKSPF